MCIHFFSLGTMSSEKHHLGISSEILRGICLTISQEIFSGIQTGILLAVFAGVFPWISSEIFHFFFSENNHGFFPRILEISAGIQIENYSIISSRIHLL